jgi:hypothetical protein
MAAAWTADGRDMERTSSVDPPSGSVLVDWRRDLERSGGAEIGSGVAPARRSGAERPRRLARRPSQRCGIAERRCMKQGGRDGRRAEEQGATVLTGEQ